MLQDAGTAAVLGAVSLLLGKDVTLLQGTSTLDLTFKDAGKLVLENAVLPALAEGAFFALALLVADGICKYESYSVSLILSLVFTSESAASSISSISYVQHQPSEN